MNTGNHTTIENHSVINPSISTSPRLRIPASSLLIYLAVILAVTSFAFWRTGAEKPNKPQVQNAAAANSIWGVKEDPFFSLTSSRTYASNGIPSVWVNYRGVNEIDFRVYKLKDPAKFFKNLKDAHQIGEGEDPGPKTQPALLETINDVKDYFYNLIKDYVREQISNPVRRRINNALGRNRDYPRRPLNVADYARVPLLNPDQMVTSWRERMPDLENTYDRRQIPLGKKEPGVYLVEAVNGTLRAYTVAIVTDTALVQKISPEGDVFVQTVNRRTGLPQANSSIEVLKNKVALANGQTNNDGIFQTKVPQEKKPATEGEEEVPSSQYLVMAKNGENFAISDLDSFYFSEYENNSSKLVGYIYTDRPVYRPEHKVYFKGILRNLDSKGYTLLQQKTVNVTIEDPDNGQMYDKQLPLSSRGTFKGEIDVPAKAKLGGYTITARVSDETTASGYFEVDEYKKPEYKVTVRPDKPYVAVGEKSKFTIEAKYFFGAPVANAEVKYYVTRSRYYSYWWRYEDDSADYGIEPEEIEDTDDYYYGGGDLIEEKEGKLDSQGKLVVEVDAKAPEKENAEYDYQYRIEAQVTDSSRRVIDGSGSFVATRGTATASAYSTRWVYNIGQTALIQVRAGDYQGKPISTKVTLQFNDRRWEKVTKKSEDGSYTYDEWEPRDTLLSSADVTTDERGMATYEYKTEKAGTIFVRTVIYDKGKAIPSSGNYIYVTDGNNTWAENYLNRNYGAISMIPDKSSYTVGDTAHVLALLPHDNVSLLITTEMFNVMSVRRINVTGRSVMIDVPIESRYAPNVYLSVSYVKNNEFFTDEQKLVVPAREKMIDLEIIPNKKEYRPRETASYTVVARTLDGKPVPNAEVSLGVVDEAIYSIRGEQIGNIKADFYGRRWNRVVTDYSTTFRVTGYAGRKPALLAKENKKNYQLADFKNEEEQPFAEPTIRKNFQDTAFWNPEVVTGADGKATVQVILPDNLTTWRATARAVTPDTKVGTSLSRVVSTKNLILRLEIPRFVTAGDTVTLSGIVHNFLKQEKRTQISLQATGGQLLDNAQQSVNIPTSGETRIDWRVTAPNQSGEIVLLAKALTDTESDAVELRLKVLPRGIPQKQSQAVTTQTDAEQTISMTIPASADENAKTLRIEAAPSVASTLLGALDYLTSYPYGCTEQTMSSFLPNVIVAQALKNVPNAKIKADNKLNEKVQKGLDRLYAYQHADGGWGWWQNDQNNPFMTAYVIDGLVQAKNAGYDIDQSRIERGHNALKAMLDRNDNTGEQWINLEIRSYMVYALNLSGNANASYTDGLIAKKAELQPYGRALLALALKQRKELVKAQAIAADIAASAKVNSGAAYWTTSWKYKDEVNERFDVEATALSLKALSNITPTSTLLPQAARWLVQNRRYGYYWDSTRQTAFAVLGLIDYVKVSRELTPNYQLEVYLNGEPVINRRVTTTEAIVIERKGSQALNMNQIRVVKRGAGTLYFTAAYDYYADEQDAMPSQGLSITREYLRLKITEVNGKPTWQTEPLTGEVRSGDLIVSRLRVVGQKSMYMMIEDPIPAGCEQVESVSGLNLNYTEGKWTDWYSSREFRDDKTVLFSYWFDGDATYQYAMRVQIPGDFKVIPARAELMYQPEIQGHTTAGFMRIMDKK